MQLPVHLHNYRTGLHSIFILFNIHERRELMMERQEIKKVT